MVDLPTERARIREEKNRQYWDIKSKSKDAEKEALILQQEIDRIRGGEVASTQPRGGTALQAVTDLVMTEELFEHLADIRDRKKQRMEKENTPTGATVEVKKEEKKDPLTSLVEVMHKTGWTKEEVRDFFTRLPPEVLPTMYAAGESNSMIPVLAMQRYGSNPQNVTLKDVMDLWKMAGPQQSQQQGGLEAMASIVTALINLQLKQMENQKAPQGSSMQDALTVIEKIVSPMRQELGAKDRELWDERFKRIEERLSGGNKDPLAYWKELKQGMAELGITASSGGMNDREFEIKKLELEQNATQFERTMKHEEWQDEMGLKEKGRREIVKEVLRYLTHGPGKKIVEAFAEAGEEKIRGTTTRGSRTYGSRDFEGAFPCPTCQAMGKTTLIPIPIGASEVICETCKGMYLRPPPAGNSVNSTSSPTTETRPEEDSEEEKSE